MSSSSLLIESIESRRATVAVIGLGYVGLPLSLVFTRAGFSVLGFDVDETKARALHRGDSYIRHIGADAVRQARDTGRFDATTDFDRLAGCDAIVICVPTPLNEKHEPDLSYIESTGRAISSRLRPGQLIVLESSTYPGTTEEVLIPILEESGVPCREMPIEVAAAAAGGIGHLPAISAAAAAARSPLGATVPQAPVATVAAPARAYIAFSPEREDPGNRKFTTAAIPKLVGGVDEESGRIAVALYRAAFESVVPVSSARVAEMAKILENTYRCVNIALVNELKQLCMRMDIDINEVIDAAATKPFGFQAFYPGPGLGGHCIPIDPFYLSWKAKEYDFTARFIELAGEINTEMPYKVVEFIAAALNHRAKAVKSSRVLILGVAYKKDIDDLRESPSLKIIDLLRQRGAHVEYNDPQIPRVPPTRHYHYELLSVPFSPADAAGYDCVVIATDHSAYDYAAIARHAALLIDTRNATRGIHGAHVLRC
jgi:UDP-N-acetyl-D-glucosamine dehydrogenase